MARKTKYDQGYEAGKIDAEMEILDKLSRLEDDASAEKDFQQSLVNERLAEHKVYHEQLWTDVDKFSKYHHGWITDNEDDIASHRVRGRVPTHVTIGYDDGYSYHTARRIGGLYFQPQLLSFEASNPEDVGSVVQAAEFMAEREPFIPEVEESEENGKD